MTFEYIAGFFDADGYVSVLKQYAHYKVRNPIIGFTNVHRVILEKIAAHIESELGIKGTITKKAARKENHSDSYDLKYRYGPKVIAIINAIYPHSTHPSKLARMELIRDKIPGLTHRQGKYSAEMLEQRQALEEQILSIK